MTTKTLTDDEGGTLHVYSWASGRVSLVARDGDHRAEFGPVERHVLLDAIREVAGETECDAIAPDGGYQCTRERGHITEHVAMTIDGEVRDTWPVETDDKPEPAPAPSTPREALALAVDLAYEVEGDEIPERTGCMIVRDNGKITALPDGYPIAVAATFDRGRRLLLDPPAPVTPAWHNARIVEATCRGRVGQWARTATGGLWVSLDGESREAYTPDLSDVTVVVPGEVEA